MVHLGAKMGLLPRARAKAATITAAAKRICRCTLRCNAKGARRGIARRRAPFDVARRHGVAGRGVRMCAGNLLVCTCGSWPRTRLCLCLFRYINIYIIIVIFYRRLEPRETRLPIWNDHHSISGDAMTSPPLTFPPCRGGGNVSGDYADDVGVLACAKLRAASHEQCHTRPSAYGDLCICAHGVWKVCRLDSADPGLARLKLSSNEARAVLAKVMADIALGPRVAPWELFWNFLRKISIIRFSYSYSILLLKLMR